MFVQVNLMQYMKLSTSRDFRINAATLEAALQEQDDSLDVSSSYETNTFTLNSFGSMSCPFSDHRVSAGRGDTRAQTEEEKTLGLVNGTSCWVERVLVERVEVGLQSTIFLCPERPG